MDHPPSSFRARSRTKRARVFFCARVPPRTRSPSRRGGDPPPVSSRRAPRRGPSFLALGVHARLRSLPGSSLLEDQRGFFFFPNLRHLRVPRLALPRQPRPTSFAASRARFSAAAAMSLSSRSARRHRGLLAAVPVLGRKPSPPRARRLEQPPSPSSPQGAEARAAALSSGRARIRRRSRASLPRGRSASSRPRRRRRTPRGRR